MCCVLFTVCGSLLVARCSLCAVSWLLLRDARCDLYVVFAVCCALFDVG